MLPSITWGTRSTRCATIASGPCWTWSPCGMAYVLMSGTIDRATCCMRLLSSGVHIEAQNYEGRALAYVQTILDMGIISRTHQNIWPKLSDHALDLVNRCGLTVSLCGSCDIE